MAERFCSSFVPLRLLFESSSLSMQETHSHQLDCNTVPKKQSFIFILVWSIAQIKVNRNDNCSAALVEVLGERVSIQKSKLNLKT